MIRCFQSWPLYRAMLGFGLALSFSLAAFADGDGTPALQINAITDPAQVGFGSVFVTGLDQDALARLKARQPTPKEWQSILSIRLRGPDAQTDEAALPNVAGHYQVAANGLRFDPRFSPTQGTLYAITAQIEGHAKAQANIPFMAKTAQLSVANTVDGVYPSAPNIPENTLRVYAHFSQPMARGQAADRIRLLDHNNQVIENTFIFDPVGELWDPDQRRLTLLFDPGRIKRGVAPNRIMGPALKADSQVTLVVDQSFKDADGRPLNTEFRRTYRIGPAIRSAILPAHWTVQPPQIGSHSPLRICFPRTMDSALMTHAIRVYDTQGLEIAGQVSASEGETEWIFIPKDPWSNTRYVIRVDTDLEDISGNTLLSPMDAPISLSNQGMHRGKIGHYEALNFTAVHRETASNQCSTGNPNE